MRTNVHHPVVTGINTLDTVNGVHVIQVADDGGGAMDLFIKNDWSDWDALVAKVTTYRLMSLARRP